VVAVIDTVFPLSDTMATICFAACLFVATIWRWLLFEDGICFCEKPADINDGWIRYVRAIVIAF